MLLKIHYPFATTPPLLVKQALEALGRELTPKSFPGREELPALVVHLRDEAAQQISAAAQRLGLTPATTLEQLAYALHHERTPGLPAPTAPTGDEDAEHRHQVAYATAEIAAALSAKQVVLLEAATGWGKARLLCQAARTAIAQSPRHVAYICAPTVSNVLHLIKDGQAVGIDQFGLLLGRQNFVSLARIRQHLADLAADENPEPWLPSTAARIEEWLARGAPPTTDHAQALQAIVPGISHLTDDFVHLAPQISPSQVALRDPAEGEPADRIVRAITKGQLPLSLSHEDFIAVGRVRRVFAGLARRKRKPAWLETVRPQVEQWLASGARPVTDATRALLARAPTLAYLLADFLQLAPEIPAKRVCLPPPSPEEPAEDVLARLKETAAQARVVYCTMAMLLTLHRREGKEGTLPFTHLFIDEVHELESVAANLYSCELSLLRLVAWCREHPFSRSAETIAQIRGLMTRLSALPNTREGFTSHAPTLQAIKAALGPVRKAILGARKLQEEDRKEICADLQQILGATDHQIGLSFSPIRRYPSVFAGPRSVHLTLTSLWERCQAAVTASATVFVPQYGEPLSSVFMVNKLAIPKERLRLVGPLNSAWVTNTPILFQPVHHPEYCYPSAETVDGEGEALSKSEAYSLWIRRMAAAILHAAASAKGGTLVLATAFRDIGRLHAELRSHLGSRLITHRRGISTSVQREAFIRLRREGERPVWLASGAAWTGLDLRDKTAATAAEDLLLTDLVILRVPFGLERSSTHFSRRQYFKFSVELWEAAIRLRQGLGRLVRRPGLSHRRIWLLDGRLTSPQHRYFAPLVELLRRYPNRDSFTLPALAKAAA